MVKVKNTYMSGRNIIHHKSQTRSFIYEKDFIQTEMSTLKFGLLLCVLPEVLELLSSAFHKNMETFHQNVNKKQAGGKQS